MRMAMTIQELIERLQKIENKDVVVSVYNQDNDTDYEILDTEMGIEFQIII